MCGIFGISITKESELNEKLFEKTVKRLFTLSESRGKEAAGFALRNGSSLRYHKTPLPASDLVKSTAFHSGIKHLFAPPSDFFSAIGHSRLVTNGYEQYNENNQPVIKNNIACIHNGIIVNSARLWEKYQDEQRMSDLDSELIPTILRRVYTRDNDLRSALSHLYREIYGMTSIALLFNDLDNLLLATNNGSLYYLSSKRESIFIFASEYHILKQLTRLFHLKGLFLIEDIRQLHPGEACLLKLKTNQHEILTLEDSGTDFGFMEPLDKSVPGIEEVDHPGEKRYINTSLEHKDFKIPQGFTDHYNQCFEKISVLRRCNRCILPETFPFIEFDEKGICNYCRNYAKIEYKGIDAFHQVLSAYRRKNHKADCLMPFSGGRDSSYALHVVKKEMGMNPIAYSYDWGMLTDLARRNQARMCGKLGVEHILISADIRKKRDNIRKNVLAWLKRPNLGTIPLFMAGDKQYFYYANLLMKQNDLRLSILGENMLETTKFKSGFCGIKPKFDSSHTYSLSMVDKMKMMFFYGKEYLLNPAYLNSSLWDTLDAFKSYYIIKHQNINIYDYIPWDENTITGVLINEYDWETDPGTETTWRIGDGTAAFYNYIYYMVAGFSENDTFRSNQVREGDIPREQALAHSATENNPRWDSIKWYLDTIGLPLPEVLKRVNKIPKLYG